MGRFEKKKKKSSVKFVVFAVAVVSLAATLVLLMMPKRTAGQDEIQLEEALNTLQTETTAETSPVLTTMETSIPALEFPLQLEDGRLTLENLFQFEGMNPDCGYKSGDAIASVTIKNTSDDFLTDAVLILDLADGTKLNFLVSNLPAGKEAMAFSIDNSEIDADAACVQASCEANWIGVDEALPAAVSVSTSGTTVTVTNLTSQEISGLTVYCRDPLDEEYFGGKAHEYTVNNLSANGTATVEALDCILGMADVVRVAIHE